VNLINPQLLYLIPKELMKNKRFAPSRSYRKIRIPSGWSNRLFKKPTLQLQSTIYRL